MRFLILTLTLVFAQVELAHAELNDTGQSACYDASGNVVANCTGAADDGRYGRDAAQAKGVLYKTGAGAAGLDYTKVANDGTDLAAGAALGSNSTDWACTRDNVTGLIWEVKTTSGLRSNAHAYTWYSTDAASNGGNSGDVGSDTCGGTLSTAPYNNQCNTANYIAAVNAAGLCGASDWRLPSLKELQSLTHFGASYPSIDTSYFPNTQNSYYWTASNSSFDPTLAWSVVFYDGSSGGHLDKPSNLHVRLVRWVVAPI